MTRKTRFGLPTFRAILLSSAAIVALGAAARAETGPLPGAGPWLSVEGRYAWQSGSRQPWAAFGNGGSSSTALSEVFQDRVKSAWGGRAVLGIRIVETWDLSVAYTGLTGNKEKDSVAAPGNVIAVLGPYKTYWNAAHLEIRDTLQSGDFEVGYNMGLGMGRARLFGGVRIVSFDQHTHVNFEYPSYTAFDDKRTRFLGAGPRIGASGDWPVAALGRGQLKLIGSIGGSVVVGESSQPGAFSANHPEASMRTLARKIGAPGSLMASRPNSAAPTSSCSAGCRLPLPRDIASTDGLGSTTRGQQLGNRVAVFSPLSPEGSGRAAAMFSITAPSCG
jgi:hypothetical protein